MPMITNTRVRHQLKYRRRNDNHQKQRVTNRHNTTFSVYHSSSYTAIDTLIK